MTPVTIEDQILNYYEQSAGCSATFQSPPPSGCPSDVQGAYAFSQTHALTILIAALFMLAIVQMIFSTIFPSAAHH